jgi:hypothetical protein
MTGRNQHQGRRMGSAAHPGKDEQQCSACSTTMLPAASVSGCGSVLHTEGVSQRGSGMARRSEESVVTSQAWWREPRLVAATTSLGPAKGGQRARGRLHGERGTTAVGRRRPGIGQSAQSGRQGRVSRSDGLSKVVLTPDMDAACRKMSGAWARA